LITKPAIVLADEPTGNLDSKTSAEVLGLIKRTSAEFRQTVVMITHNNDIARLADRIVRMLHFQITAINMMSLLICAVYRLGAY
jgi:putative ABC transport system ATP-binding protein